VPLCIRFQSFYKRNIPFYRAFQYVVFTIYHSFFFSFSNFCTCSRFCIKTTYSCTTYTNSFCCVPCGTNSISKSPFDQAFTASRFDVKYEPTAFFRLPECNKIPSPFPASPKLLLTTVKSFLPDTDNSSIKVSGVPDIPKPPTSSTSPSLI